MRHLSRNGQCFSILVGLSLFACAQPPGEGSRIVLERADRDGYWRATYRLDGNDATSLRFQRPAGFFREDVWQVVTPGWRFARDGEWQLLVAEGSPKTPLVVEFPVHTDNLPKEYEFFESFTDGSVAIYTGHLYLTDDESSPREDTGRYLSRVELVPAPGEHLVVQGQVLEGRQIWVDPHGDGTYVYFGSIAPVETAVMTAVIDPGAPSWLVERMNRVLPELFRAYTDRFGETLVSKPVVLFNFEDLETSGFSSGGGTLPGLIQMSAVGHAWRNATPETSEGLLYLVAHEAVHMWNGQVHPYRDDSDSWMHEGSADAFADLMLSATGVIDSARLAERRDRALNECVAGLRDGPLSSSLKRGAFHDVYACGNVIALWSAAAVAGPGHPEALFDIWRAVFRIASEGDGRHDREAYFGALATLGADATAIEALRRFVDAAHPDPGQAMVDLMRPVGIDLVRLDRVAPDLRRDAASRALAHLMSSACDGRISYRTEGDRFRTYVLDACEPFSRELEVVAIEGYAVQADGDRAAAAVAERCEAAENVRLDLEHEGWVSIPCRSPFPAEPAPLAFPRGVGKPPAG